MAYVLINKNTKALACATCGRPLRQLRDHQSVQLLLQGTLAQRRGSKCINCGEISCSECSKGEPGCFCGTNARIALPYIEAEKTVIQSPART